MYGVAPQVFICFRAQVKISRKKETRKEKKKKKRDQDKNEMQKALAGPVGDCSNSSHANPR